MYWILLVIQYVGMAALFFEIYIFRKTVHYIYYVPLCNGVLRGKT